MLVRVSHKRQFCHAFFGSFLSISIFSFREGTCHFFRMFHKFLYLEWDPVIFQIWKFQVLLVISDSQDPVNICQLSWLQTFAEPKKSRRFHKTPDDGRGFCFFFLGEKQKERYFWQKKDIGFSISQERKRLEQVVDNPQNRLTQLKTGEKTRWSTRLCFLFIWFLMTICTANTGYVYIYITCKTPPRKIRCFCFIYQVYRYNKTYFCIHIYIAYYISVYDNIYVYIIWMSFS